MAGGTSLPGARNRNVNPESVYSLNTSETSSLRLMHTTLLQVVVSVIVAIRPGATFTVAGEESAGGTGSPPPAAGERDIASNAVKGRARASRNASRFMVVSPSLPMISGHW